MQRQILLRIYFTLNLVYQVGTLEQPKLMHLANYLQFLGTDSLSFHEFRTRLHNPGSTISFDATDKQFFMRITGFDKHFKETVQLAGDFIRHVKADDKQIRQVINDAKSPRRLSSNRVITSQMRCSRK